MKAISAPRTGSTQRTELSGAWALRHPWCPIYPLHPYLPKGAKGPGNDAQPLCPAANPDRRAGHAGFNTAIGPLGVRLQRHVRRNRPIGRLRISAFMQSNSLKRERLADLWTDLLQPRPFALHDMA
jgi:hypothetical protein